MDKWPACARLSKVAPASHLPTAPTPALKQDFERRNLKPQSGRNWERKWSGPLRVDGVFGPLIRAAIRRFQRTIGVEITGHLTPADASRLIAPGSPS